MVVYQTRIAPGDFIVFACKKYMDTTMNMYEVVYDVVGREVLVCNEQFILAISVDVENVYVLIHDNLYTLKRIRNLGRNVQIIAAKACEV